MNLADISRLPLYRTGDIAQLSSYDTTGNNDDGFSGKYSYGGNDIDGNFCDLPIPYEKLLKVVYTGKLMRFHQIEYRSLDDKEKCKLILRIYLLNIKTCSIKLQLFGATRFLH
ncbi:MAG: hypothetical protein ABIS01_13295 [Ferruginibacter sp.]